MLRKVALVGAVALLAASAASAAGGVSASLSKTSAGARDVGLTIELRPVALQCGRLGVRTLSITLPAAMRVPRSIPADAVQVGVQHVSSVATTGRTVVLSFSYPVHRMTCDSMVLGPLRIRFTAAAGLGNPSRAGTYAFAVAAKPHGMSWHGSFVVRS